MISMEVCNELTLQVKTSGGNDVLYTKAGAFIAGQCFGGKNYKFDKVLLGPQGNPMQAIAGQLLRRITWENLPLMKVSFYGDSVTYYANDEQHIVIYDLQIGETICLESESILAFTDSCKYGVKFLGCGVISQKGLVTSTLTGNGPNAQVAFLVEGNPIMLSNLENGSTIEVDPDTMICFVGSDPGLKLDLSWKNLIGQSSGESYMLEWGEGRLATVVVQPKERKSGIDISMDGKRTGNKPTQQQRVTAQQTAGDLGDALNSLGNILNGGSPRPGGGGRNHGGFGLF